MNRKSSSKLQTALIAVLVGSYVSSVNGTRKINSLTLVRRWSRYRESINQGSGKASGCRRVREFSGTGVSMAAIVRYLLVLCLVRRGSFFIISRESSGHILSDIIELTEIAADTPG